MQKIKLIFAANVTYQGITFNTKILVEYRHTGRQWFKGKNHFTENEEIANRWKEEGKKVREKPGHYFIDRLAIPNGSDWWYINNPGDKYTVNKASKYWRRKHEELSKYHPPITKNIQHGI